MTEVTGSRALSVVCGLWVALVWLWEPAYLVLTVDDAFYYVQIARHVAAGDGPTFDGLQLTNGFHPAWLVVLSALALPAWSVATLARVALSVQIVLVRVAFGWLGREDPRVQFAAAALLTNFWFAKVFVNGQESALVLLFAVAALIAERGRGALIGGLVLARLDAVVFAAAAVAARPRDGVGAAIVVMPWAIASLAVFGHVMPVSGAVKYGNGLIGPTIVALVVAIVGARVVPEGWRRYWPLAAYAVGTLLIAAGDDGIPPIWRLVPLATGLVLVAAAVPARAAAALLVALASFDVATWALRLDSRSYAPYVAARASGEWLAENTDPDDIVAGWDCGIVAAHGNRRLINLEGLVGSWAYYDDVHLAGDVGGFVDRTGVEWIAQDIPLEALRPGFSYDGVRLGAWHVARRECVAFRSIVAPTTVEMRLFFVAGRTGSGPTFDDLARSGAACPP